LQLSVDVNETSPVQVSGMTRQFDPDRIDARKTSIIDQLSLNVDRNDDRRCH
jgi:hypothetical protein